MLVVTTLHCFPETAWELEVDFWVFNPGYTVKNVCLMLNKKISTIFMHSDFDHESLNQKKLLTWPPPSIPHVLSHLLTQSSYNRPTIQPTKPWRKLSLIWWRGGSQPWLVISNLMPVCLPPRDSSGLGWTWCVCFFKCPRWLYCAPKNENYYVKRKLSKVWGPSFHSQQSSWLHLTLLWKHINISLLMTGCSLQKRTIPRLEPKT